MIRPEQVSITEVVAKRAKTRSCITFSVLPCTTSKGAQGAVCRNWPGDLTTKKHITEITVAAKADCRPHC